MVVSLPYERVMEGLLLLDCFETSTSFWLQFLSISISLTKRYSLNVEQTE